MSRYAEIQAHRADHRRQLLDRVVQDLGRVAAEDGLHLRLFGSYARKRLHGRSDLDVLVLPGPAGRDRSDVMERLENIGRRHGVVVDVAFADLSPHLLEGSVPWP